MRKVLLIITSAILLLAIPVTIYFVGQKQNIRSKAAPSTSITLKPVTSSTVNVGDEFSIIAYIDANKGDDYNPIYSAGFRLTYDVTKLETSAENVTKGDYLVAQQNAAPPQVTNGTITYGAYSSTQVSTHSAGTLATIKFKALVAGTTVIDFDRVNTLAYGVVNKDDPNQEANNVISDLNPITITINTPGGSTGTPTPTVDTTATVGPNPTATTIPQPTPTGDNDLTSLNSTPTPTTPVLNITNVRDGQTLLARPTFKGTAKPYSSITITIHSDDNITATVIADGSGKWSYTPDTDLSGGSHTISLSESASDGSTRTTTQTFTVNDEPAPVTGTTELTLLFVIGGLVLMSFGAGTLFIK
jgi:hypothetical protein